MFGGGRLCAHVYAHVCMHMQQASDWEKAEGLLIFKCNRTVHLKILRERLTDPRKLQLSSTGPVQTVYYLSNWLIIVHITLYQTVPNVVCAL